MFCPDAMDRVPATDGSLSRRHLRVRERHGRLEGETFAPRLCIALRRPGPRCRCDVVACATRPDAMDRIPPIGGPLSLRCLGVHKMCARAAGRPRSGTFAPTLCIAVSPPGIRCRCEKRGTPFLRRRYGSPSADRGRPAFARVGCAPSSICVESERVALMLWIAVRRPRSFSRCARGLRAVVDVFQTGRAGAGSL